MEWAHEKPDEYQAISELPQSEQNAALRAAIAYDPGAILDRLREMDLEIAQQQNEDRRAR